MFIPLPSIAHHSVPLNSPLTFTVEPTLQILFLCTFPKHLHHPQTCNWPKPTQNSPHLTSTMKIISQNWKREKGRGFFYFLGDVIPLSKEFYDKILCIAVPTKFPHVFFSTGKSFQPAWLLEFPHPSCISLEAVMSSPICGDLGRVFPFQLRAVWRSQHKLHFPQQILMGWINSHDQAPQAGSQQGQIPAPVRNSSRCLNHGYLHYSSVKITLALGQYNKTYPAKDDILLLTHFNEFPLGFCHKGNSKEKEKNL